MADEWLNSSGYSRASVAGPTGYANAATFTHDGATAIGSSFVRQVGSAGYCQQVRFLAKHVSGSGVIQFRGQGALSAAFTVDLVNGTIQAPTDQILSTAITSAGNGWYWAEATISPNFITCDFRIHPNALGDAYSLAAAHLGEIGPYQRVNTATDYDTAGFPHYLKFDGVDDFSQVGPFAAGTLTSTMDVFVLMRRNSSAGFCLLAPSDNSVAYGFALDGNANGAIQDGGYVNGRTWVNGVELTGGAAVTADQLHDALPVGKWHVVELHSVKMNTLTDLQIGGAGIGFPLNGAIAEVILAPAQSAEERTKVREYLAAKAGITLP